MLLVYSISLALSKALIQNYLDVKTGAAGVVNLHAFHIRGRKRVERIFRVVQVSFTHYFAIADSTDRILGSIDRLWIYSSGLICPKSAPNPRKFRSMPLIFGFFMDFFLRRFSSIAFSQPIGRLPRHLKLA